MKPDLKIKEWIQYKLGMSSTMGPDNPMDEIDLMDELVVETYITVKY